MNYQQKYLKYKTKYLNLKMIGGAPHPAGNYTSMLFIDNDESPIKTVFDKLNCNIIKIHDAGIDRAKSSRKLRLYQLRFLRDDPKYDLRENLYFKLIIEFGNSEDSFDDLSGITFDYQFDPEYIDSQLARQAGFRGMSINLIQSTLVDSYRGPLSDNPVINEYHSTEQLINYFLDNVVVGTKHAVMFDWDRTISLCEHIINIEAIEQLFSKPSKPHLHSRMAQINDYLSDMLIYLCGGPRRLDAIRKLMRTIYEHGADIVICTNNTACPEPKKTITELIRLLMSFPDETNIPMRTELTTGYVIVCSSPHGGDKGAALLANAQLGPYLVDLRRPVV
jgi:hypothetical protein